MSRIWNKYPYTDFHELNLSWVIDKITDFEARLTDVEEDVADLKTRMTSIEGRMTTAEERIAQHDSDIAGLSSSVSGIRNRVTALENADIQDAAMLESVSSVEAGNASITVNFVAATYANGVKTAGTDAAVIPAATNSAAGVMLPGEKAKLAPISVNGNNVTFAGTVAGSAPSANNDFATKQYVDNLAITGSATVTSEVINPTSDYGTPTYGPTSNTLYKYGAIRVMTAQFSMLHGQEIPNNYTVAEFALSSGDLPALNGFKVWAKDADGLYTFSIEPSRTSSGIFVKNRSGSAIPAEDGYSNLSFTLVWIVNN